MTTPLYSTFQKRINDGFEQLVKNQVTPWCFLNSGKPMRVNMHDGKQISYEGIGFEGSPEHVFWSRYIEPFMEEICINEIDIAVKMAVERGVSATLLLPEVESLLFSGVRKTYVEMAKTDQRLKGTGYPENIPLRPIDKEFEGMKHFIKVRVKSELDMWKSKVEKIDFNEPSSDDATAYDKLIIYFKSHKVFSIILIAALLIIGLGSLTDAIDKIISFSDKYSGHKEVKVSDPGQPPITVETLHTSVSNYNIPYSPLNRDYKKRDIILKIDIDWNKQDGGAYSLDNVDLKTIELLLNNTFIDLLERQNESPTVKEFLEYLKNNPSARVHGYAISPLRNDYRVTLEGIMIKKKLITKDNKISFFDFCKEADEITTKDDLWCWWD